MNQADYREAWAWVHFMLHRWADYPLGVFDFDFARLGGDEASQVRAAQSIGVS